MSETSHLTTEDLVHEVALAAEIAYYGTTGNEASMVPVDPHDLDRCLRVVNHAVRDLISKAPPGGWRWRDRQMEVDLVKGYTGSSTGTSTTDLYLIDSDIAGDYDDDYFTGYVIRITAGTGEGEYATVTDYTKSTGRFDFSAGLSGDSKPDTTSEYRICRSTHVIDSDPSRYLLSQDFQGEYTGEITFAAGSEVCGIEWVNEAEIRRLREFDVDSNDAPFVAAILPNSTKRQWELVVYPEPTADHTIVFPYKANFDNLTLVAGTATEATTHGDSPTTMTDSALSGLYPADYFNGQTIKIISGTGKTSYAVVTAYTAAGVFTVAEWLYQNGTTAGTHPVEGSVYVVDAGETPPCGLQFDFAILSACRAAVEEEFTDVKRGFMDKYMNVDLPAAWAIDGRSAPKKLGVMQGQSRRGKDVVVLERGEITYNV